MTLRNVLLSISLMAVLQASAQTLPPVFGNETARTDELARRYITPKRMVWKQGNVSGHEVLMKEGTGQPDMAGLPSATLQNGDNDTTSILLDYGRELHGGLKLVIGSANAASSRVRIRFGESVVLPIFALLRLHTAY